jgi:hypothetical protein
MPDIEYGTTFYWILWAILIWQIPWKGVALWKAAKRDHKIWFIVFLLLNTVAILEILYIFWWSKIGEQPKKECWLCRWWKKIFKKIQ